MIVKKDHYFPKVDEYRRLHIFLPDDYAEVSRTYPVMYMYDGHNLFFHRYATYGRSWALKHYMDQSDRQMIIVGIECSHDNRLAEYSPYFVEHGFDGQPIEGYGDDYMTWLVEDVKPYIDATYRTQPERENTGIGGSSMGGLMAFYSLIAYNDIFSKAAALSPSLGIALKGLDEEANWDKIAPESRLYLSFGQQELERYKDGLAHAEYFNDRFIEAGGQAYIHVEPNGGHNEDSWRRQNARYMEFLWD